MGSIRDVEIGGLMKNPYLDNLKELVSEGESYVSTISGNTKVKTIGFFDLTGSTSQKLLHGHEIGTRNAMLHNRLCNSIIREFKGLVVKDLGDGVLAVFDDPLNACLASINVVDAAKRFTEFSTKVGLTIGKIEEIEINDGYDVLGSSVDRCARLQSSANPGEIMIDEALKRVVDSHIKDYPSLFVEDAGSIALRGIGDISIFRFGIKEIRFRLHPLGRRKIEEKVIFIKHATSEVIELGTSLRTFSGYFFQRRSEEFKSHVVDLLRKGVDFKCVMLDPDSSIAPLYATDSGEEDYVDHLYGSLDRLGGVGREFRKMDLSGRFEIYKYSKLPLFHSVCVDSSLPHGRMFVSQYMYETIRSETPGMEFSRSSNPDLYEKYYESIQKLLSGSTLHESTNK